VAEALATLPMLPRHGQWRRSCATMTRWIEIDGKCTPGPMAAGSWASFDAAESALLETGLGRPVPMAYRTIRDVSTALLVSSTGPDDGDASSVRFRKR
jgi:hypothetical protein